MTDTEARRLEFEEEYRKFVYGNLWRSAPALNLGKTTDGNYMESHIAWAWWAWQAALDAIVVEMPPFFVTGNEPCYYASDIDKAIHAAGVRTK